MRESPVHTNMRTNAVGTSDGSGASRSDFITILAWSFIGLAAFSALVSAVQAAVDPAFWHRLGREFQSVLSSFQPANAPSPAPPHFIVWLEHMRWISVLDLILSVAVLVCSVGLLRRDNWARLAFVFILVLTGLAHLALPYVAYTTMTSLVSLLPSAPEAGLDFSQAVMMVTGTVTVMALVFGGGYLWLARRLLQPEVRREFRV